MGWGCRYTELSRQVSDLKKHNRFIDSMLKGKDGITLTAEHHAVLVHCLELCRRTKELERLHIYCNGHTDAYAYFKQIGAR